MTEFTLRHITNSVLTIFVEHWKLLLTSLSLPFVAMASILYLVSIGEGWWTFFAFVLVSLIFQGIVALVTHRVTLIPNSVPPMGLTKFGARECFFLVYFVGVMGLFKLASLISQFTGIFVLTFLLLIWLLSRVSLCFPAIAIGEYVSLRDSWALTKEHQATMFMVVLVFPLVVNVLFSLTLVISPSFLAVPIAMLLTPVMTVVTIMALSISYAYIRPTPTG